MTATLALVINPVAGMGGAVALKGTDGPGTWQQAAARGATAAAGERARVALVRLRERCGPLTILTWADAMGGRAVVAAGHRAEVVGAPAQWPSTPADTRRAVQTLAARRPHLLWFVGGDGTARDVAAGLAGTAQPVLGIPAGVKMHSGVFAITPEDGAELTATVLAGGPVALVDGELRDLDEAAIRAGEVRVRRHGSLLIPARQGRVQQTKSDGRIDDRLDRIEIAAGIRDQAEPGTLLLLGPGSTVGAVKEALAGPGTLLGFDAVRDGAWVGRDLDEAGLHALLVEARGRPGPAPRVVLTFMAGQGVLLGRGNQQLSVRNLRLLGRAGLQVIASAGRIASLGGAWLRVDTGDAALDAELAGPIAIRTGHDSYALHAIAAAGSPHADAAAGPAGARHPPGSG